MRPVVISTLALLLFQQQDLSLLLEHATPPSRPVNTVATGLSIVEVEVDARTRSMRESLPNGCHLYRFGLREYPEMAWIQGWRTGFEPATTGTTTRGSTN